MNTLIKALLAATVATSGASYLTPAGNDPIAVEACRIAIADLVSAGPDGIRIIDAMASPARPNTYRGTAENQESVVPTRLKFSCQVDDQRATVTLAAAPT